MSDIDGDAAVLPTTEEPAEIYPFIPLKNVVVFPRVPIKLVIGSRSLVALEEAQQHHQNRLVVVAQRERDLSQPQEAEQTTNTYLNELYTIGTLIEITNTQKQPGDNNSTEISVEGICRVRVETWIPPASHPNRIQTVKVRRLEERGAVTTPTVESLMRHNVELFGKLARLNSRVSNEFVEQAGTIRKSGHLADYITAQTPKLVQERIVPEKQAILEELDQEERLEKVSTALINEIEMLELDERIRSKVRLQIDKNQREFWLREQLKAIHDELGGELGNETAEFRKKLEDKKLTADITDKMLKEVSRLERMSSSSPESNVVRSYLEWVLALPWNDLSHDNLDVNNAEQILNADHYGLDKIKTRILEFLAVRNLSVQAEKKMHGPILCFAGPPGVGKTSLGQSIARAMGREFVRISLGGVRDESEIRGHRRTYVGALPGRIVAALRQTGTRNPVILLDEVDKMSSDFKGDPSSALLEVLDPEQNHSFIDHYLDLSFDLSEVLFITTANTLSNIPRPLLDRMEVIDLGGYTEDEKVQIARRYLLPKQIEAHALKADQLEVSTVLLRAIIRFYTREAGVRNLERRIGTICRKAARIVVEGKSQRIKLTVHLMEEFLGVKIYSEDPEIGPSQIGVALGLAYTSHGGETLPVEVVTMPGRGVMTLTGRAGEVMQESAKAALSYARSRSRELGIDVIELEKLDLHIHLPEGAVPKDGPSAGITIATALISAISKRRIRSDTAMTGEITLRGRVLAIGGLKEKSMAAHRAGIRRIIAPAENKRDLKELPKNVVKDITWFWAETMDDVLREILVEQDVPEALVAAMPLSDIGPATLSLVVVEPLSDIGPATISSDETLPISIEPFISPIVEIPAVAVQVAKPKNR